MRQYFKKKTEVETISQIILKLMNAQRKLINGKITEHEYDKIAEEIWKEFYSNTEYR